ncbi:MAG: hypothetical protein GY822_26855 [Deltaproteobacteria bacterium]|nr:hypothetical protein [Deltaproteobacteria bacterium]
MISDLSSRVFASSLSVFLFLCGSSGCATGEPDVDLDAGSANSADGGSLGDAGLANGDAGLPDGEPQHVDVATWNMRFFPTNDESVARAAEVVIDEGWEFLAMQELYEAGAVEELLAVLPGYEALVYPTPAGAALSVGAMWKADVFDLVEGAPLVDLAPNVFSRTPMEVVLQIEHTDVQIRFIAVHLSSGTEASAEAARLEEVAEMERYIRPFVDADEHVVVLGDYNDAPTDPRYDEVLAPFFSSPERYEVISRDLQTPADATYLPASVILDHTTVTTSLMPFIPAGAVDVVKLNTRNADYEVVLSDHLPLHFELVVPSE